VRSRIAVVALALVLAGLLVGVVAWRRGTKSTTATAGSTTTVASPTRSIAPIRLSPGNVQRTPDQVVTASLEGRVLSTRTGQGVADAAIAFSGGGVISEVHSDAAGRFVWTTATAGAYQLSSMSARGYASFSPELGHSPVSFTAQPGVRIVGVTLYLTPAGDDADDDDGARGDLGRGDLGKRAAEDDAEAGRIVGSVREQGSGKAIAAFTIIAAARLGGIERGAHKNASFFDAEGHYVLDGVHAGTQCVTAYALGFAGSAERCVEVPARGEARLDFELSRGARLSGRVTDRDTRAPIGGARVSLENPNAGAATPLPVIASAETDADGRFQLSGTDTGLRSIFVTAAGHHSRVIPGLQLEADRDAPSLEIDLQATAPGEQPSIESAGINAVVSADGDTLVLGKCTPQGGADQAGLKEGDVLLRVDGVDLATLGMQAGVERLRGPEGSTVTVTFRRPPGTEASDVVVTRRRVVNR